MSLRSAAAAQTCTTRSAAPSKHAGLLRQSVRVRPCTPAQLTPEHALRQLRSASKSRPVCAAQPRRRQSVQHQPQLPRASATLVRTVLQATTHA